MPTRQRRTATRLPQHLRPLFWDHDFTRLRWEQGRDLVIGRVLAAGDWETVRWLVAQLGKPVLREWIETHRGVGLSPPQLRFWEVVLDLPRQKVNAWLAARNNSTWDRRRQAEHDIPTS